MNIHKMKFIKGATLFFLGMTCILFAVRAFDIVPIAPNAIQYIQQVFLTDDGSNASATGIILDGKKDGGITITNLTGKTVLGTDENGKIIASSANGLYEYISGYITNNNGGTDTNNYVTGIFFNTDDERFYLYRTGMDILYTDFGGFYVPNSVTGNRNESTTWITNNSGDALMDRYVNSLSFNSGTKLLTLNVSGYGIVTGLIDLSGSSAGIETDPIFNMYSGDFVRMFMTGNRNSAYDWIMNNSGAALRDIHATGMSFNSGTKILTLYMSGIGNITGLIDLSGGIGGTDTNNYVTGIYFDGDTELLYLYRSGMSALTASFAGVYGPLAGIGDIHATGMSFNSGTKILTLYMSGIGNITGLIDLSGSSGPGIDTNNYATGIYFNSGTETLYLYRTGMSYLTATFAGIYVLMNMTGNRNWTFDRVMNNSGDALRDIYVTGVSFDSGSDILTLYRSGLSLITGYIPNYRSRNAASGYLYPKTLSDRVGINTNDPQVNLDVNGWFGIQNGQHINDILNAVDRPYIHSGIVSEKGIYDRTALTYKGTQFFGGSTDGRGVIFGSFSDNGTFNEGRNFILSLSVSDTVCGESFNLSKRYIAYYNGILSPGSFTKLMAFNEFNDYRSICINDQRYISRVQKINTNTTRYWFVNATSNIGSIGEKIMIRGSISYSQNDGYYTITDVDPSNQRVDVDNPNGVDENIAFYVNVSVARKLGDVFKPVPVETITNPVGDTRRYNFENGYTVDDSIVSGDSVEIIEATNAGNNKSNGINRGRTITAIDPSRHRVEVNNTNGVIETNSPAAGVFKKKEDITIWLSSDKRIYAVPSNPHSRFFVTYGITDYTEQGSEFEINTCNRLISNCSMSIPITQSANELIGSNNPTNSIQQQFYYDTNVNIALPITNLLGGIKHNIRQSDTSFYCDMVGDDKYCSIFANDSTVLASGFVGGQLYLNLPTAISRKGQIFTIKVQGLGNGITIKNYGSETIDDAQDFTFTSPYQAITIQSDGSNRRKIQ